jgi:signal transduction histidine kinase
MVQKKPASSQPSRIARPTPVRGERSTSRREAAAMRECRKLEQLCLDLRDEADAADRSRRETLSIVSHDVRNPLSVILVSTKLLSRSIPQESNARKQLDAIGRAAEEINHLIQELLDASHIEAGALAVGQEPVELEPVVKRAIDQTRPLATQKSLRLEAELPETLPSVVGDAERLVQAISSLITNAVKFTPKAGSIVVRADAINGDVRISVIDTGPGIADEVRPHVFTRRPTEGQGAVRSLGQGTGLSVFVAKGIVEAHGGRIWVESKPGHGSTFLFSLPVAEHARSAAAS